ncbi:ECF transporter S component, partial [Streptococcus suis]
NLFLTRGQSAANVLAWGVSAPVLESLIYSEAANKVLAQGLVAGIANSMTSASAGTLLLVVYAKSHTKTGSLSKD